MARQREGKRRVAIALGQGLPLRMPELGVALPHRRDRSGVSRPPTPCGR